MLESLRVFLTDIVDYAGLFPPAELTMDQAIRNYAEYRHTPEAFMLARFLCPASRLVELSPYVDELFTTGPALRIAVIGSRGPTPDAFLDSVNSDLSSLAEFGAKHGQRVVMEALEVRLPKGLADVAAVSQLLGKIGELGGEDPKTGPTMYYEPPPDFDWQSTLPMIVGGMAEHNKVAGSGQGSDRSRPAELKLRCGGVEASAFPSVEQLADAIFVAQAGRVPMKFTAGLHHPLRHYSESDKVDVHGFMNVFFVGVVAAFGELTVEKIGEILRTKEAEAFAFDSRGLSWGGVFVPIEKIATARRDAVTSFGSCSFDEPREDLKNLGLL